MSRLTGLHVADIHKLPDVLARLANVGITGASGRLQDRLPAYSKIEARALAPRLHKAVCKP
jgi:hypothetical protein